MIAVRYLNMMGLALLVGGAACTTVFAADATVAPDKSVAWEADEEGVRIEWGPDGGFNRIYSTVYQPVSIPDRRGINKAQVIAEEKAKVAIVRFIDQNSQGSRLTSEVTTDLEEASRAQGANGSTLNKQTQRKMVEELREVTKSYAEGRLRGVLLLERGYNEQRGEAWVKVGMSKKLMNAARDLSDQINNGVNARGGSAGVESGGGGPLTQPSEIRRSKQTDW